VGKATGFLKVFPIKKKKKFIGKDITQRRKGAELLSY